MGERTVFKRVAEVAPKPVHESEPLGCIKAAYGSKGEAETTGAVFHQKAYRCPKCQKWHLTKHTRFKWTDKGRRR